jgi:hypothetical protein
MAAADEEASSDFDDLCSGAFADMPVLSQLVADDGVALIGQWISGTPDDPAHSSDASVVAGSTRFEVVEVLYDYTESFAVADEVEWRRCWIAQPGDLFLLLSQSDNPSTSQAAIRITDDCRHYLSDMPEDGIQARLLYCADFFEHADPLIAHDAWYAFAFGRVENVVSVARQLDRERLLTWVLEAEPDSFRQGIYGLMLGYCGTDDDAAALRDKILEPSPSIRQGLDGVITGYLLLAGEEGLEVIEREKLYGVDAPFSETYASLQSIRWMLTYEQDRISRERLLSSLYPMLDRPDVTDLIIPDLARWQDWTVIDRVYEMYDQDEFSEPAIKRQIVRYLYYAQQSSIAVEGAAADDLEQKATRYLDTITAQEPLLVEQALKYVHRETANPVP